MTANIVSTFEILGGIGWDPEIRGFLTVALASAVLIGSVWLLLVTNTGVRLGSLIALAGFFGWFMIMAFVWWIFGIGYAGDSPSWTFVETISDPAGEERDGLEDFIELPDPNCFNGRIFPVEKTGWTFSPPSPGCAPRAMALIQAFDGSSRDAVIAELATVDEAGIRQGIASRNILREISDPRYLNPTELNAEVAKLVEKEEIRLDQISLSALSTSAPQIIDWAIERNYLTLGDWRLLSTIESGEAANAASAFIVELGVFPADSGAATPPFVILDSYQRGGKPEPESEAVWERVANKITNSIRLTHPVNDVIIQAKAIVPRPQELGQPAPLAEIEEDSRTVSIHLRRNLGNLRLVPGLLTIGSGLIFAALVMVLHVRHRKEVEIEEIG